MKLRRCFTQHRAPETEQLILFGGVIEGDDDYMIRTDAYLLMEELQKTPMRVHYDALRDDVHAIDGARAKFEELIRDIKLRRGS
jgi:hypothetical protein